MSIKKIIAALMVVTASLAFAGVAVAKTGQKPAAPATSESTATTESTVDTDNVNEQVGDQTAPDTQESTETAGETGGEAAGESDGPGGHEDPPGNVDHQFDGQE